MSSYINKKDMARIRELDLLSYLLNYAPQELVAEGKKNYRLKSNHSVVLNNGFWCEKNGDIGGVSALDYFIKLEHKDFLSTAHELLDLINSNPPVIKKFEQKRVKSFKLPPHNKDNNKLIYYLCNKRKLDRALVNRCIRSGILYEDVKHNAVFVGFDDDYKAKYAFKRSTYGDGKYDVEGSQKEYGFKIGNFDSKNLHVFESAIDLLSYISLNNGNMQNDQYLALGGVGGAVPPSLEKVLKWSNATTVILHLDNDEAGRRATKDITEALKSKYTIIDEPPKFGKDFNEMLVKSKKEREER